MVKFWCLNPTSSEFCGHFSRGDNPPCPFPNGAPEGNMLWQFEIPFFNGKRLVSLKVSENLKNNHFSGDCIKTLKLWVSMVSKSLSNADSSEHQSPGLGTWLTGDWSRWKKWASTDPNDVQHRAHQHRQVLEVTWQCCYVHCGSETFELKTPLRKWWKQWMNKISVKGFLEGKISMITITVIIIIVIMIQPNPWRKIYRKPLIFLLRG